MTKMLNLSDILGDTALTVKWLGGTLDRVAAYEQAKTLCSQIEVRSSLMELL